MQLTVIAEPVEPLDLSLVKTHCHIDHDAEDDYLNLLISAARRYAEHYCQRSIGEQTLSLTASAFPIGMDQHRRPTEKVYRYLPQPPLISVDWVKYYSGGVLTTWDAENYRLDLSIPGNIVPVNGFPSIDCRPDAVQIQWVAGVSASENIKLACLIMVSHWYMTREPIVTGTIVAKVPWSAHALLDREKWGDF